MKPPLVVVGNLENRRVAFFRDAALRLEWSPPREISWLELTRDLSPLDDLPPDAFVRLDSPGEDWLVEKALIGLGAEEARQEGAPAPTQEELECLAFDQGRIRYQRAWYLGFRALLRRIDRRLQNSETGSLTPHPDDVEVLFDKRRCHAACVKGGVPVPDALGPVDAFDRLVDRMRDAGWTRAFVKPAHGSSASGVVAFESRRGVMAATTTAELVEVDGETRLYNSLKVRRYTDLDIIRSLVDRIASDGVHVEEWLPKASLQGRIFDVRALTVAGQARHVVVRQSRGPLTNLHLGNRRGDVEKLFEALGDEGFERLHAAAEGVAKVFPRTLAIGVDLLITPGFRRTVVLEANAFGDLLPGVVHRGESSYEAQLAAMERLASAGRSV